MQTSTTQKNKVIHTWTKKDGTVCIRYEAPDGSVKTIEKTIDWYFLIENPDLQKAKDILDSVYASVKIEDQKNGYTKIFAKEETKFELVLILEENGIKTYEGDIINDRRWYIDAQVEISDKYKKLYFDIETDDSIRKIEIGRDRIVSYAAVDSNGKIYFEVLEDHTDSSEEKLLRKFLKMIEKYDILLGWNSSGFDVPYLKLRMKKYGLNLTSAYCWRKLAHFDLLKRFRHIFRFDNHIKSFGLEPISQHFLGRGKIPHDESIMELWKNNQPKLKEYNIEDCLLVKDLDEKLGVSGMMIRQSQWCGVPVAHFGLYSIIDSYILRTAHKVGKYGRTALKAITERSYEHSRSKENPDDTDTEKAKYAGALVLEPKTGRYDRVYTFDFKGLYPSMMRTSNIGYDSIRYEADRSYMVNPGTLQVERKAGGLKPTYFVKEPSVINLAITELIKKRSEYKKLKLSMIEARKNKGPEWEKIVSDEIIVKEIANSTYGIMGLDYGRYFSIDIAESITLFGQWCILFAKKNFEDRGYDVIYGDTDSVFVSTKKGKLDIEEELKIFHEKLRKELKETYNIDECFIELAFDKQYESFLLVNKKTYAGHVINMEGKKTDEIYTRGLEYIKKNTFGFAADKQRALVETILKSYEGEDQLRTICMGIKKEFYDREFSKDELTITQKVGQALDTYKKTPPLHVRLAIDLKDKTGLDYVNTEVEYIITKKKGSISEGTLASDFKGDYDKDFYWDNKTLPVLERITEVLFQENDLFEPKPFTLF